ncbi:MAG: hypothetical protein HZB67_00660 [Candidatus Aenigmarchaeota archaeon]|nr:hypothetical protein [Candidatus Aenigmarchaeota archaeon]
MKAEKVGEYAFLACVVIAILAGIAVGAGAVGASGPLVGLILVVLGVVVGLTTVAEKEVTPFLIAVIALLAANAGIFTAAFSGLAWLATLGAVIDAILRHIAMFVAPAAIILSVKAIYALASKK